jgi:hypothetical protein
LENGVDDLKALESMGLVLPSAWYIVGAILFGIVGLFVFRRGRKAKQSNLLWIGLALMLYPYAVSDTWLLWAVGAGLTGFAYWKWNET